MTRLPSLGPRGEGWVAAQLGLLAAILIAGPWVGGAWYGDAGFATGIAGVVLIVLGAALGARGIVDLGGALTPLPHPRDDADLVEDGVYAQVRHPIYGGLIVASFGWGLL
ncbi:MAG: methyltransferase family protein [Candidatus Limnocylindria bacterium]